MSTSLTRLRYQAHPLRYQGVGLAVAASYAANAAPTMPTGPQPLLWLLPRAASASPAAVHDYRTTPPVGLSLTGSLPVATSYAGKLAWVADGSTAITVSGLGLAGSKQLTVLMGLSLANFDRQCYLFTYNGSTNNNLQSFDTYTGGNQLNFRVRGAAGQGGVPPGYLNPAGTPSAFAVSADFTNPNPYSTIEPQSEGQAQGLGNADSTVSFGDSTLCLLQEQGGADAFPAGSLLRYYLVFREGLPLAKCAEWMSYLTTLP